jgi:hypothetical protein
MAGWATIHTADALELLSPSFKSEEVRGHLGGSVGILYGARIAAGHAHMLCTPLTDAAVSGPQVRGHAVSVLQQKEDEELLSFLLQLVQVSGRVKGLVGWLRMEIESTARVQEIGPARSTIMIVPPGVLRRCGTSAPTRPACRASSSPARSQTPTLPSCCTGTCSQARQG